MKVLLVNTPQSVPETLDFPITVFMPMGLACMAAVLEKNGVGVRILDTLAEGWENHYTRDGHRTTGLDDAEILQGIRAYSPDLIGITAPFSFQARNVYRVAKLAKGWNPKVPIVVGGPHATVQTEKVLQCPEVDWVIRAEGDHALLELARRLEQGVDVTSVPGLAWRKDGAVVQNGFQYIADLNQLPMPAHHLLPMEKYFDAATKVRASRSISTYRKRWATLITSRGCPFQCVFCSIKPTMGKKWRARSAEKVIEEMEHLVRTYGIEHFDIEDDNFSLHRDRFEKILDMMIERRLGVEWSTPNGIMAQTLTEDLVRKMKKSGCVRAVFAPESGDPRVVREVIGKKINLSKIEDAVRWCKQYGITSECFFVLGCPGETLENMRTSIEFARKMRRLGADDCGFFIATPFFGTELHRIAKEKGYLRDLFQDGTLNTLSGEPLIETEDFTAEQLKVVWREAQKVNPPISLGRIKLALAIMVGDPGRFVRYAKQRLFGTP